MCSQTRGDCAGVMIRHTYGPKIAFLHIISETKQACFRPFFANVGSTGPTLALEVANRHLGAQEAARTIFDR